MAPPQSPVYVNLVYLTVFDLDYPPWHGEWWNWPARSSSTPPCPKGIDTSLDTCTPTPAKLFTRMHVCKGTLYNGRTWSISYFPESACRSVNATPLRNYLTSNEKNWKGINLKGKSRPRLKLSKVVRNHWPLRKISEEHGAKPLTSQKTLPIVQFIIKRFFPASCHQVASSKLIFWLILSPFCGIFYHQIASSKLVVRCWTPCLYNFQALQ